MAASQACMYSFKSAESAVVRLPRVGRKTGLGSVPKMEPFNVLRLELFKASGTGLHFAR